MATKLILGSQSPRRAQILNYFHYPFIQEVSPYVESQFNWSGQLETDVKELAEAKAKALIPLHPDAIILCADTIVCYEGQRIGKPKDREEARHLLSLLSGEVHSVYTGLCLTHNEMFWKATEHTLVEFNTLTPEQIDAYLETGIPYDKAGGYAIQESGSIIVNRIDGCYHNVMGLPINTLQQLFLNVGINLWNYL